METILTAEALTKSYRDIRAVDGVSFDIGRGEIFGLLGPNGAGKTTTVRMLSGLMKPDGGSVSLRCTDPTTAIGFCPQEIVIWENLTCLEQLVFMGEQYGRAPSAARKRGQELLSALGLMEKRDRLGRTLSGGMRRRLNIALALVHDPEILFLDEPQAGLDPQSRVLVRDYLRAATKTTTIVLTTHDMEEAEKLSDRICIIDRGRTLISGTVGEITRTLDRGDLITVEIKGDLKRELLSRLSFPLDDLAFADAGAATFTASHPDAAIGEILRVAAEEGIVLERFGVRKPNLEDVFIALTGRGLRE